MTFPIPHHVETLQPYIPGKPIEETKRELGLQEVIKLASNENPLGPSPLAVQAIRESLVEAHLYPDGSGFLLKQKLASHLGVTPEQLVLGNGSNEIIELLVKTFVGVTDHAIISQHSFIAYKLALHANAKQFVEIPTKNRKHDLESISQKIGAQTKLIFLANPENPTGAWLLKDEWENFLAKVAEKNAHTLVVVDEAYFEYVTDSRYPNSLHYHHAYPHLITLRTFSKIYGLAGLRLGYGVMAPWLAAYLDRTRLPFNVSVPALVGGLAALDDCEHVKKSRESNSLGRQYLQEEFEKLGVQSFLSQTNFLLIDFGFPAAPVFDALLRQGVIVRPVANYGLPNSLRVTVGTDRENEQLIIAMKKVL